jgi:CBS domain-containing protein
MKAGDVMSAPVVTVRPDTPVREIARTLLTCRISAVPVTDIDGKILGIVSEGDLIRRAEFSTAKRASWWLGLLAEPEERAFAYLKGHGPLARDVMTSPVETVSADTQIAAIAELLEERRIKRVPVVRGGKIVGIVSRANLLHGLASDDTSYPTQPDDESIRKTILDALDRNIGLTSGSLNVTVADGVVHLWGVVTSEAEKRAVLVAAQEAAKDFRIDEHVGVLPKEDQPLFWVD